jgi:hypothetical protein
VNLDYSNPNFDILLPCLKLKPHLPKSTTPDFILLVSATAAAAAGHSILQRGEPLILILTYFSPDYITNSLTNPDVSLPNRQHSRIHQFIPEKMTKSEEECSDDETPSGSAVTPSSLSLTDVAQDIFGLSNSSILKTGDLCPSEEIDDDKVSAELTSHLYLLVLPIADHPVAR